MSVKRAVLVGLAALAFGLFAGWCHGNDGGLGAAFANLIAPWLLVAAIPAWWARSPISGALIGLMSTMLALVGFYLGLTAEMYGHLGNVHGLLASLRTVNAANKIWYEAGLVSGPLCGLLAALLRRRMGAAWLWGWIGFALLSEFVIAAGMHEAVWVGGSFVFVDGLPHLVELIVALGLFAFAGVRLRREHLRYLR